MWHDNYQEIKQPKAAVNGNRTFTYNYYNCKEGSEEHQRERIRPVRHHVDADSELGCS